MLANKILEKFCVKGIRCCHGNPVFGAMFTQILTFLIFPLIDEIFKTRTNCLLQSQLVDILCNMLHVTCDVRYCAIPFFGFQAFLSQFVFENVENRTKTILVTRRALNTRNLSKRLML